MKKLNILKETEIEEKATYLYGLHLPDATFMSSLQTYGSILNQISFTRQIA